MTLGKLLKVSHHPLNFSGYRDFGRGEIMTLVCHVIFQNHVMKVLCDYGQKPITLSYYPVKLGGHRHGSRTILLWTIIPRTISPSTTASQTIAPDTISTQDNYLLDNYPRIIAPRQFPLRIITPRTIAPRAIPTYDNCPRANSPWTVSPENCHLQLLYCSQIFTPRVNY